MHSTWFSIDFLSFLKFPQIKEGEIISSGKPIFQNDWIIQSPFLYFIFRKLKDSNSLSFFTFQCVLHDSVVLFSIIWDFLKLKGGPNFWGEANSAEGLRYLVPPSFCISCSEIWRTQILCQSLDFNGFCIILCHSLHFSVFYMIQ